MVDWDERYRSGWAYGKQPNAFLAAAAAAHLSIAPLRVLSLGEGQGRNVAHLAAMGHECTAVDASAVGLAKARCLAEQRGVAARVTTLVADLEEYEPGEGCWDVIVMIFCALPPPQRARLHRACARALRPGGLMLIECFAPRQTELRVSGGGVPGPDAAVLVEWTTLAAELDGLEVVEGRQVDRRLSEGGFHRGAAALSQLVARKPGPPLPPLPSLPPLPPAAAAAATAAAAVTPIGSHTCARVSLDTPLDAFARISLGSCGALLDVTALLDASVQRYRAAVDEVYREATATATVDQVHCEATVPRRAATATADVTPGGVSTADMQAAAEAAATFASAAAAAAAASAAPPDALLSCAAVSLRLSCAAAARQATLPPTAYRLLPTAYCLLPTAYCLLPTAAYYSLLTTDC